MLLRFSVKNYKSIWEKAELSMLKSSNSSELPHHLVSNGSEKYLKSAAILGANASGKSNLLDAMEFAISLMKKPSEPYNNEIFKLNKDANTADTEFEFDILIDNCQYWYSFGINKNMISYEILKKIEGTKEIDIYSRESKNVYNFSESFWSNEEITAVSPIQKVVRKHNLFLAELRTRETKLSPLNKWISSKIIFLTDNELNKNLNHIKKNLGSEDLKILSGYLKEADVGIVNIDVIDDSQNANNILDLVIKNNNDLKDIDGFRKSILEHMSRRIQMTHKSESGSAVFNFEEESMGTQKYLKMLPILLKIKDNVTVICDELETSLHPKLTKFFLQNFFKENTHSKSQLIFTTHEFTLLNLDTLRRDEIWFVQKNKNQESELYSLAEFKERNDTNFAKAYLEGRFGGVPILKDVIVDLILEDEKIEVR